MGGGELHNAPVTRPSTSDDTAVGRLPVTFRVAVLGSASVGASERAAIDSTIEKELLRLARLVQLQGTPTTPVRFAVVSSLAEGIPRIAALVAIRLEVTLEVILAGRPGQVSRGLSEYSRGEFQTLLQVASSTTVLAPRRSQYGQYVAIVSRCDALIKVHSKADVPRKGEEADEVVEIARSQSVPVVDLAIDEPGKDKPPACSMTSGSTPVPLLNVEMLRSIDRFNKSPIPKDALRSLDYLTLSAPKNPVTEAVKAAVLPYFARADFTALRCQRTFRAYSVAVQMLAIMASIFALTELALLPGREVITWAETASLVLVVVSVWIGRRAGWHDMWQSARYLAERIRWAIVVAATGASEPLAPRSASWRDRSPDWVRRAFREVWLEIPSRSVTSAAIPQLRSIIADFLGDQIAYRRTAAMFFRRHERRLRLLGAVLFSAGLGLAIVHSLGSHDPLHAAPQSLGYLSVLVPIISGAIAESSGRQDYGRRAEEFTAVAQELMALRQAVILATKITQLQDYVLRSELIAGPQIRREGLGELEVPT
jgi:hypothetical protein